MFKKLQGKLVTIFVLLVLAIMTVTGTFLILSVSNFYHELFAEEMDSMFEPEFVEKLSDGLKSDSEYLKNIISAHTTVMGIDSYRNYYIIAPDGEIIDSSTDQKPENINTPNFITALSGEVGREVSAKNEFMDYAVPVSDGENLHIIYVIDTKEELMQIIQQIFAMILQALLLGVVISFVLGYFLSRTITNPVSNLTKKAKRIAEGEFEYKIEVSSEDEIGTLTMAFNDMSSQLQKTMLQMSTENNKFEEILKNMTDGIMAFGVDGKVMHINPVAKKMFKISDTDSIFFDSFFEESGVNIKLGDLLYLEEIGITERDIILMDATIKATFSVFEDELDKTRGVIVVLNDVTKQQRLENSRREFVANVSHELRTPLTTVKSYAETLLELETDSTALSFTNTILSETDRMTRLVKDLLVLSSLDHFQGAVKNKFDMTDLISDVVSTMQLVAREQGHRLILDMKKDLPVFYGDRDKIEQLLYNIISNSIKYTPNGGKIEVVAERVYNDIVIKVIDNGIGIPEKDLPRIFERFYRVDKARSREGGGTGLGLAISQGIVEQHDGNIAISSVYGEGTVVAITLPVLTA